MKHSNAVSKYFFRAESQNYRERYQLCWANWCRHRNHSCTFKPHSPGPRCSKGFLFSQLALLGQRTPSVNQSGPEDTKLRENGGQGKKDLKT